MKFCDIKTFPRGNYYVDIMWSYLERLATGKYPNEKLA